MRKLLSIFIILTVFFGVSFAGDYVVITNKSNSETSIKKSHLKNIFLGKKQSWKNGDKILPAMISPKKADGAKMVKAATNYSSSKFDKYWMKRVYSGAGVPPFKAKSSKAVIKYVGEKEGAIGLLPKGTVISGNVKEISIK